MELLLDPHIWIGLFTLIILEIVLGIDNLVFIAILVKKLPPAQRDKARVIGLSLALLMRLGLLSVMSWLVTLTTPILHLWDHPFSGRDLILMGAACSCCSRPPPSCMSDWKPNPRMMARSAPTPASAW